MASKTKQSKEENVKLKKVDKDITEEGYEYAIIPPDGGFGWVIALAAMVRFHSIKFLLILPLKLFRCAIWFVMVLYLHLV